MADFLYHICKNKTFLCKCQIKEIKMFSLEFFKAFCNARKNHVLFSPEHIWPCAPPGHIPGHWEGLLDSVASLGGSLCSLNDRYSPWASGQLGKAPEPWPGWIQLGKAGQGFWAWTGLDTPSGTHWNTPWQELCWLSPESAVLVIFELCTFGHTFW